MRRAIAGGALGLLCATTGACAGGVPTQSVVPDPSQRPGAAADWLREAEEALSAGDAARARVGYRAALGEDGLDANAERRALFGLADASESTRDFSAAIAAYERILRDHPEGQHVQLAYARKGACEAELGLWPQSATSFAEAARLRAGAKTSLRIEALARQGYALFMADELERAGEILRGSDELFARSEAKGEERFDTYYFVGMTRFYLGAIAHRQFQSVEIALPETAMAAAFTRKLALLEAAQDHYRATIRAKHVYWVSAAGFQMGQLFQEFHDALMHAPVPDWLDARQKRVFYAELKQQLRPIVNKAIWVFEKNISIAEELGVDNAFVVRTERQLARLQTILLEDDDALGRPRPRLASPAPAAASSAPASGSDGTGEALQLAIPQPTPLPSAG